MLSSVLGYFNMTMLVLFAVFVAGGLLWARFVGLLSKIPLVGKLAAKIPLSL